MAEESVDDIIQYAKTLDRDALTTLKDGVAKKYMELDKLYWALASLYVNCNWKYNGAR